MITPKIPKQTKNIPAKNRAVVEERSGGILGGLNPNERRRLKKKLNRRTA